MNFRGVTEMLVWLLYSTIHDVHKEAVSSGVFLGLFVEICRFEHEYIMMNIHQVFPTM